MNIPKEILPAWELLLQWPARTGSRCSRVVRRIPLFPPIQVSYLFGVDEERKRRMPHRLYPGDAVRSRIRTLQWKQRFRILTAPAWDADRTDCHAHPKDCSHVDHSYRACGLRI